MSYVVDANVAIKWAVKEALHEEARHVLDLSYSLTAPDLISAEICNVLRRKVQLGEIGREQGREVIWFVHWVVRDPYPSRALAEPAYELALQLGHPAYDCFYLAYAQLIRAPLITADAKFAQKAAAGGFADHVIDLALIREAPDSAATRG
jgi:predicted nucleic acid-binding protein